MLDLNAKLMFFSHKSTFDNAAKWTITSGLKLFNFFIKIELFNKFNFWIKLILLLFPTGRTLKSFFNKLYKFDPSFPEAPVKNTFVIFSEFFYFKWIKSIKLSTK